MLKLTTRKYALTAMEKLETTKEAVIFLLDSTGPRSISEIRREIEYQAFGEYLSEALHELTSEQVVIYSHNEEVFELL